MKGKSAGEGSFSFAKGAKVEVTSSEDGFAGAWYEATVVAGRGKKRRTVEYEAFVDEKDHSKPLREVVDIDNLRPRPPPGPLLRLPLPGDQVEACVKDGWWPGAIVGVLGDSKFLVRFHGWEGSEEVGLPQLRVRKIWIPNRWVSPTEAVVQLKGKGDDGMETVGALVEYHSKCPSMSESAPNRFCKGDQVEVSTDEEGFIGAWFVGTIIEPRTEGQYIVEYKSLMSDDDSEPLREVIDFKHIRPAPPDASLINRYVLLEEVDAFYNDGWWVGMISKVLKNGRYVVFFRQTMEEMEFKHTDLRLHFDWCDGKWLQASKVMKL